MNEKQKGQMAAEIIKKWKDDEEVRKKYAHDFSSYAFNEELRLEWERPEVRDEFQGNYEGFFHFKMNEHRTNIIGNRV